LQELEERRYRPGGPSHARNPIEAEKEEGR
jgi:hypothetical protein